MALTDKKYEKFYKTTGSGDDKVDSNNLSIAEQLWDFDRAIGMKHYLQDPSLAPLVFQLQQIQDELDYLRTEISTNKDKTGISSSQTSAITANTAKTSFPGFGTSNSTALVGDTKLISIGSNTTISFGDLTETTSKGKTTYTIAITATRDFGGKTGSQTKSITLTLS